VTAIPELWSDADSKSEDALTRAAQESDLLSCLVAIDGLDGDSAMDLARQIAEWAVKVRIARDRGESPRDALAEVLVAEAGLAGDDEDYFAPDNSRISRVVARRKGQPILLSCVWMLVGRGAGIDIVGVGLPGHFVVGIEGLVVDPYGRGRYLSYEQCTELAARAMPGRPFDRDWLAPVEVRAIAARVLRNLSFSHRERGDERGLYRATRMLAAALPDEGPVWVELARQTEAHGAWPEALSLYRHIARHFSERREGQIGELKAIELESRTRVLN
jgi:regulator of sirC expression with transglutaminase-like and TPR domain